MNVRRSFLGLATLAALLATACGGSPPAVATATNSPAASPSATAAATATPTATPALPLPTGQAIPPIVTQVIAAVATKQTNDLVALLAYQNVACTTAQGAGGPPKCKTGEAQGTVQKVFATGRCEAEWTTDGTKAVTDAVAGAGSLYAAAKVTPPNPDPEPTWPKGDAVVVFRGSGANAPVVYFVLSADKIVRAQLACDAAAGGEDALIKSLGASAYYVAPPTAASAAPPASAPTASPTPTPAR